MLRILKRLATPIYTALPIAASLGGVAGAGLVIAQSDRRDTFLDCVGQVSMGTIMGGATGVIVAFFSPVLLAGTVLGAPMYAYQRFRFPPGQGKPFRHETRLGSVLISRELS